MSDYEGALTYYLSAQSNDQMAFLLEMNRKALNHAQHVLFLPFFVGNASLES